MVVPCTFIAYTILSAEGLVAKIVPTPDVIFASTKSFLNEEPALSKSPPAYTVVSVADKLHTETLLEPAFVRLRLVPNKVPVKLNVANPFLPEPLTVWN